MLMTEENAADIWCPQSRVLLPINQAGNRISTFQMKNANERDKQFYEAQIADCSCIGSRCAMWRWSGTHAKRYITVNGQPELLQSPETRQGYCGLAGKPLELG